VAQTSRPLAYLKLIRPKQWLKNFFVFAPLIFAHELFHPQALLEAARAFAAFCLCASAIYVLNDITDLDADRAHPWKRNRPIAAGIIPVPAALVLFGLLLGASVVLTLGMDRRFLIVLATYVVVNVAYSLRLKEILLLDVFVVAAGFMFRVVGGAYAINVRVSSWLVLCSLFVSLFLGFAKRRGELQVALTSGTESKRKVLSLYRVDFIDQMLTVAAAGTVISYALYTVAPRTIEMFHTEKLIYTTVFVLYGMFRYLYLTHTSSSVENPTSAVTSDIPILVNGILWILACVVLIYAGDLVPLIGL